VTKIYLIYCNKVAQLLEDVYEDERMKEGKRYCIRH